MFSLTMEAGCQSSRVWEVRKSVIMAGTTETGRRQDLNSDSGGGAEGRMPV